MNIAPLARQMVPPLLNEMFGLPWWGLPVPRKPGRTESSKWQAVHRVPAGRQIVFSARLPPRTLEIEMSFNLHLNCLEELKNAQQEHMAVPSCALMVSSSHTAPVHREVGQRETSEGIAPEEWNQY